MLHNIYNKQSVLYSLLFIICLVGSGVCLLMVGRSVYFHIFYVSSPPPLQTSIYSERNEAKNLMYFHSVIFASLMMAAVFMSLYLYTADMDFYIDFSTIHKLIYNNRDLYTLHRVLFTLECMLFLYNKEKTFYLKLLQERNLLFFQPR
jgi:hypothetical protein